MLTGLASVASVEGYKTLTDNLLTYTASLLSGHPVIASDYAQYMRGQISDVFDIGIKGKRDGSDPITYADLRQTMAATLRVILEELEA